MIIMFTNGMVDCVSNLWISKWLIWMIISCDRSIISENEFENKWHPGYDVIWYDMNLIVLKIDWTSLTNMNSLSQTWEVEEVDILMNFGWFCMFFRLLRRIVSNEIQQNDWLWKKMNEWMNEWWDFWKIRNMEWFQNSNWDLVNFKQNANGNKWKNNNIFGREYQFDIKRLAFKYNLHYTDYKWDRN
jgi:hypothetical protein